MDLDKDELKSTKELFEDRLKVDEITQYKLRQARLDYMDQLAKESLEKCKQKQRENKKKKSLLER